MLEIVEDVHLAARGLRGDNLVLLRHVAGPIYFTLVVYLQFYLDALVLGDPVCPKG